MTAPAGDNVNVGSVSVEVVASARRFARSLRREVDQAFQGAGKSLQRIINRELGGQSGKNRPQIRVRIDDSQVAREARRALTTVRRVFRERGPVRLRMEIPQAQAAREANAAARAARKTLATNPVAIRTQVSQAQAARQARAARAAAQAAMRHIQLRVELQNRSVLAAVRALGRILTVATAASGGLAAIAAVGQGASAALAGITAAAGALVPVLGQLVSVALTAAGALAALPGAFAIAGAGIGALVIGSSGLGAALQEVGQQAGGAGGAAVDMSRQIERASRQVVLARRGIARAARGVELAERSLADAQRQARLAQEELNRARERARENLDDLTRSLEGARLDEEAAVLRVAEAEQELAAVRADPESTVRDIKEADLAHRQALHTLAEVQDRVEDLTAEQADAARKGVQNADVVVAARERQRDAAVAVEDAEYELSQAHLAVADAEYQLAQANRDLAAAQTATAASGGGVASAMSQLAPAAQELVRTLIGLKAAWDALRLDVQQTLWAGVAAEIQNLAEAQLPVLRAGLVDVADVLNRVIITGLRTLSTEASQLRLGQILDSASGALDRLAVAVEPLIAGLLDLTAVGAQVIEGLAGPAGELLADLGERISAMAESGALEQLILDGLDALKLLGNALLDIGGIFRGIFSAAGEPESGGIFGFLERLNTLINSVEGQEALGAFFAELGRIGDALMPVLLALGRGLGVVAGAIADVAEGTAPFLNQFVTDLATALSSLAPAFVALGPAVVALGRALLPLATVLSDLVVGIAPGVQTFLFALADGLQRLVPAAKPVGEALAAVLEAVAPLLPLLGSVLANAVTEIATVLQALAEPIGAVIELFSTLALQFHDRFLPILLDLSDRLLPVFADAAMQILEAFEPLIPLVADLAEELSGKLADALPDLADAFTALVLSLADLSVDLVEAFVQALIDLAPELPGLAQAALDLAQALLDMLVALTPLLPDLTRLALLVLRLVTPDSLKLLTTLVRGFTLAVQTAGPVLKFLLSSLAPVVALLTGGVNWDKIGKDISGAFTAAWETVSGFFTDVYDFFAGLSATIRENVGDAGKALLNKGRDLVTGLLNGIINKYRDVKAWLGDLPGRVRDATGNLLGALVGKGRDLLQGLRNGITDRYDSVRNWLDGLGDRVKNAVGDLGRLLLQTGKDIIAGLARGMRAALPNALDVASDIAGDLLDEAKQRLGITSPSRVFADLVGREIPAGIAMGIKQNREAPQQALDDLAADFASRNDLSLFAGLTVPELAGAASAAPTPMEVHLHNSSATIGHLEALQARQAAIARVGRPR